MPGRQTRAERAARPLARDSVRKIAESLGGCLRLVQLRRTDTVTGEVTEVMIPCGTTSRRSARRVPSGPKSCGRRNAEKAGTSRPSLTSPRPARMRHRSTG